MLKLQFRDEPERIVKLTAPALTLGRDSSNTIVIASSSVSDFHAEISWEEQQPGIIDLLSATGTFVNGQRINSRTRLQAWDLIRLGTVELEVIDPNSHRPQDWALHGKSDLLAGQFHLLEPATTVGRDPGCELAIDNPLLSRRHAQISIEGDHLKVIDLGSANGTFVNGERVEQAEVHPGDELRFDKERFVVSGPGPTLLDADGAEDSLTLVRGSDTGVSLAQEPEEQAIIDIPANQAGGAPPDLHSEPDSPIRSELPADSASGLESDMPPNEAASETPQETPDRPPFDKTVMMPAAVHTQLFSPEPQPATLLGIGDSEDFGQLPLDLPAISLGRSADCDLTLDDPSISKRHASLTRTDNSWSIEDCRSSNGVFLNNKRVSSATLKDGDKIRVGRVELEFRHCGDTEDADDEQTPIYHGKITGTPERAAREKPNASPGTWLRVLVTSAVLALCGAAMYLALKPGI